MLKDHGNSNLTIYGQNAYLWTFWNSNGIGYWLSVSVAGRYPEQEKFLK
jgi:hypothetical protein